MSVITKTITVNGQAHSVTAEQEMPLLWVLRDILGLTGTKYGCGVEICGACTVLHGGEPEESCDMSFGEVNAPITTVEGLSPTGNHPLQQAWIAQQVPQCGYCQPGMLMEAAGLLAGRNKPSDAEITSAMSHICACGTYQRIRAAIHQAAGN